ncbi:MAG: hypothetical protein ACD_52C00157G0003 [uncultured bacterium]|nr:MAG: hypothetical protein ACD_52C00157G0003 [uncultured bacterium]
MKKYIKKKAGSTLGFRTSDFFKGSKFSAGGKAPALKFNTSTFRIQHKG